MSRHELIFRNCEEEPGRELGSSEGSIPLDLKGTFYRNGPGVFHIGADVVSFFDAAGIVAGLSFEAGRAYFRARLVESPLLLEERSAGRMMRRRAFTNLPRGNFLNMRLGNAVMHDAVWFAGRLFATDDGGWFRLDDRTLATQGEDRLGIAARAEKMCPVPRVDERSGRLVTYSVRPSPRGRDSIRLVELDETFHVVREQTHTLFNALGLTHEVAFTENYYVVTELAAKLSLPSALIGRKSIWQSIRPTRAPARIHLVPKVPSAKHRARAFDLPAPVQTLFHVANAFERDDAVVVDAAGYPWVDFAFTPPERRARDAAKTRSAGIQRYVLDQRTGAVTSSSFPDAVELPRVNPSAHGRPYRFIYSVATPSAECGPDPFVWTNRIAKTDVESRTTATWDAGPDRWVSQPAFAPRPNPASEDDGYILVWLVNASTQRAEACALDAKTLSPVCTVDLGRFLGLASHARFEPKMSLFPTD
ncbi:MAG: carotenoid oxygenase family protein [Deltaproteobacteria bacterium]|nr:carotenoid oxygenase family protein [Deltaproteobacteria bacterium]